MSSNKTQNTEGLVVGDSVEIIDSADWYGGKNHLGKVGTITSITREDGDDWIEVDFGNQGVTPPCKSGFFPFRFKKVSGKAFDTSIVVGDKVHLVDVSPNYTGQRFPFAVGREGKVTALSDEQGEPTFNISWTDGTSSYGVRRWRFEKVAVSSTLIPIVSLDDVNVGDTVYVLPVKDRTGAASQYNLNAKPGQSAVVTNKSVGGFKNSPMIHVTWNAGTNQMSGGYYIGTFGKHADTTPNLDALNKAIESAVDTALDTLRTSLLDSVRSEINRSLNITL